MQFAGLVPEDAPDPRVEARRRLIGLPFPLMGLVPQPTVEQIGAPGIAESTDGEGRRFHLAVMLSYVLSRNPADRTDPADLKEVDEREQPVNDSGPLPFPAWLIANNEMMRYPQLWGAVQTSWYQDDDEHTTLMQQLIDHTNYILVTNSAISLGSREKDPMTARGKPARRQSIAPRCSRSTTEPFPP